MSRLNKFRDPIWTFLVWWDGGPHGSKYCIFLYIMQFLDFSWNFMNFLEISWNFTKFHEISWNFLNFLDISWNFLKFREMSWHFMNFRDISGHFREFSMHRVHTKIHVYTHLHICAFLSLCGGRAFTCTSKPLVKEGASSGTKFIRRSLRGP